MSTTNVTANDLLLPSAGTITITPIATPSEAAAYFATRLHCTLWTDSSDADQLKAIYDATRCINKFQYKGWKTDATQPNEFPRTGLVGFDVDEIPESIKFALYEIAYAFLDGVNVEQEIKNLRVTSRGFSSVRTTYDSTQVPEFLRAGVPSSLAWDYLKPFLADNAELTLRRVS